MVVYLFDYFQIGAILHDLDILIQLLSKGDKELPFIFAQDLLHSSKNSLPAFVESASGSS